MHGVYISYFFVKNTLQTLEKYGIIIIEWESIIIKKKKIASLYSNNYLILQLLGAINNRLTQLLLSNICSVRAPLETFYTAPSRACARARRLE